MLKEQTGIETELVDLAGLMAMAARARLNCPELRPLLDIVATEIRMLERRGVSKASQLDLATDLGMALLESIESAAAQHGRRSAICPRPTGDDGENREPAWKEW